MNEPDLLNLQIGDVLYRRGSNTPCVVVCTKPEVVVTAAAVVTLADCAQWDQPATESPKDMYHVSVSLIKTSPDGSETQVRDTCGPVLSDLDNAIDALNAASLAADAELAVAAS